MNKSDNKVDKIQSDNSSVSVVRVIFVLAFVIAFVSIYILVYVKTPTKNLAGEGGFNLEQGVAQIGGKFELIDQNDNKFNSENLLGKISLVYFGFTYCPDICPTSLNKLSKVIKALRQYRIDCNLVFITIDPERDTSLVLKEYLKHFDSSFIGLTGNIEDIKKVADDYKVYFAKAKDKTSAGHYLLDHSSFVYLMDKKGRYVKHFYLNTSPEEIIDFIRVNMR
jgi:protein SCO1/2